MASLYKRLGGDSAIVAVVDDLYGRLMGDPRLAGFFADIDLATLTRKQVGFLTWAFDGPSEYRGRDLGEAHRRLVKEHGLDDGHFNAVAEHLAASLRSLSVQESLVEEVLGIVATTRDAVLGRPN